ncbi:MAG TPA: hypothetical protein VEC37_01380 [Bacillota bacterium]|nr:hypothetical protein [Bacillota bacterium]
MKQWRILAVLTLFVSIASLVKAETPVNPGPTPTGKAIESSSAASPTGGNTPVVKPPVVEVTGTETRLLPANFDVWSCEWAPDGKAMVFSGKIQGELSTKMRIWMWPLNPITAPVPFTNTDSLTDYSPRWSPDGKQLVMMRVSYGKSSTASGLWLKDVTNGSGKQLTIGNQDRDPAWAPDGKRIVFSRSYGPYQAQLIIINTVESTLEVLLGQENELLSSPCWGQDGKIYFTKMAPASKSVVVSGQTYQVTEFGKGGIWSVDLRDRSVTPVVVDEYDNRMPALSPDGTKLAFVSDRYQGKDGNGKFDRGSLYIKDLATGEIKFVTNKVGLNGGSLTWSPDGKKLAFFTFRSIRPAVWVINVEPLKNATPVVASPDSGPTPSPVQK